MNSEQNSNNSLRDERNESIIKGSYKKISNEKRPSLIRLVFEQGQTILEASGFLGLNYSSERTIVKKYSKYCIINLSKRGGSERKVLSLDIITKIENIVTLNPQFTLK